MVSFQFEFRAEYRIDEGTVRDNCVLKERASVPALGLAESRKGYRQERLVIETYRFHARAPISGPVNAKLRGA